MDPARLSAEVNILSAGLSSGDPSRRQIEQGDRDEVWPHKLLSKRGETFSTHPWHIPTRWICSLMMTYNNYFHRHQCGGSHWQQTCRAADVPEHPKSLQQRSNIEGARCGSRNQC